MTNKAKERVIWAVIIMLFTAAATVGACSANAASVPQIHATIVESDTTKKADEKVGTITIQKSDGSTKTYDLYRGKRGGYYYFTGKVDKNGKPQRKYLTKKQKEANNLK